MKITVSLIALMLAGTPSFGQIASPDHVRIGVLGLFHPHHLVVLAKEGSALVLHAGQKRITLERSSGVDRADVHISGTGLIVRAGQQVIRASELEVTGGERQQINFVLAVPDKLARSYRGKLTIAVDGEILLAIIDMDIETAVASVVSAETLPDTPIEALKAQAVAARSYFTAGRGRHHDFDFCDTTHCQFLREAPGPDSPVARAVSLTRGFVMENSSTTVAAMYTRSCSGRTHTPAELGLPAAAYPYYSVECKYCREHPSRWRSQIDLDQAAGLKPLNESARLDIDRRLGWSTVPSNDFTMKKEGGLVVLEGVGGGHGIGLCQSGAKAMAEEGANFRQILNHYYPNTAIVNMDSIATFVH